MSHNDLLQTEQANATARAAMESAYNTCNRSYQFVDGIRDNVRVNWGGAASRTYLEALALWLEELRLITNGMNEMVGAFGGTVQEMAQMEDQAIMEGSSWLKELNPNQAG
ncbi:hypothetical protein [Nocardiopsis ansamitocini]|uniref:WXG100 family type VII secretion target n=1 Tax=Nocardiopsis ansamitocini TaxID=1670832 RepID=A0A9W6PBI3_9ACTN|nr:hypothetical protein [Nocardiopsis ansamitocini]GLU50466.1 hypothetical protein Nans01_48170 [Nocardiopsis ansamitocini]